MPVKLVTELVGTFFLVLTIGLTAATGTTAAPLAIGSALMVMIYMGGHVSGAHYNPAVTLAVWLRGKLPASDVLPYMLAQLAGATSGALASFALTGRALAPAPGPGVGALAALLAEALFTFALALVVLNVATAPRTEGNSHYGLAIGFTVLVGAYAAGGISGGAFNPAVGLGPALANAALGTGSATPAWLYLVGPFAGGALAAALYRAQNPERPVLAPRFPTPADAPRDAAVRAGEFDVPLPGARPRSRS